MAQQSRAREPDHKHHHGTNEQRWRLSRVLKAIAVDYGPGRLSKIKEARM
jgi:hypothetical protein